MREQHSTAVNRDVGARVHTAMWRSRVTQAQLGQILGVSQSVVSKRLRGVAPWSVADLVLVAQALDVEVVELLPRQTTGTGAAAAQ